MSKKTSSPTSDTTTADRAPQLVGWGGRAQLVVLVAFNLLLVVSDVALSSRILLGLVVNILAVDFYSGRRVLIRPILSNPERGYWIAFGVLLCGGFVFRLWETAALGAPGATPDSASYLLPALQSPLLPFSETRTAGVPYLCSAALNALGHPAWILVSFNLLWLISTALLCVSLKIRLDLRFVSLALLGYLCFAQKNLRFEFDLMSEHPARCIYVACLGVLVFEWGRLRWRTTLALALMIFAGVMVKPTTIVLVPGAALAYAVKRRVEPSLSKRTLCLHVVCLVFVVGGLLAGYGLLYKQRFGKFGTNAFTFTALYAQVGHLTDLEATEPPELMAGLRQILPKYKAEYADRGDKRPNWLVFGTFDDERLRRDFGSLSPCWLVEEELRRSRDEGITLQQQRDQLYRRLALGAIKAHPRAYLALAASDFALLFTSGIGAFYGNPQLQTLRCAYGSPPALAEHRRAVELHLLVAYDHANLPRPAASEILGLAHSAGGVPGWVRVPAQVYVWGVMKISAVSHLVLRYGWVVLVLLLPLAFQGRRVHRNALWVVAISLTVVIGYGVLLALICVSETPRFTVNVQDYVALSMLVIGWVEFRVGLDLIRRRSRQDGPHAPAGSAEAQTLASS